MKGSTTNCPRDDEATRSPSRPGRPSSVRSGRWRQQGRSHAVRGLGLDRDEEPLLRAGEQPVDEARPRTSGATHEPVLPALEPFDFELLSRLDAVLLPDFRGQDNLTLGGDRRLHKK